MPWAPRFLRADAATASAERRAASAGAIAARSALWRFQQASPARENPICAGRATAIYFVDAPSAHANVAQLVEQLTRNEQVSGSSPLIGSRKRKPRESGAFRFPGAWADSTARAQRRGPRARAAASGRTACERFDFGRRLPKAPPETANKGGHRAEATGSPHQTRPSPAMVKRGHSAQISKIAILG